MAAAETELVDQFGFWLKAETGGSPFFVAEMLQMLQEQDVLVTDSQVDGRLVVDVAATLERLQAAEQVPLPPTVREVILTRLERLSDNSRSLLLAEAVIGRQCSFQRLCQIARLDEFEGLPALEELLNSRLMLETDDEARPFTFAHDNIRDVVYTEAGTTRRRLYHRQALTALEQDKAPPAELAFHALTAGLQQPAFAYALAAGDDALALHAFADAVNFYEQSLKLTDRVDPSSDQLCHLCTHYGRALELSGRYQNALDHYVEAAAAARQNGYKDLELAMLVAQGTIYSTANELSDFELGESLGQKALTLARELADKAAEAKIQWNLLNVYRFTGHPQLAQAAGERSLALAQELSLREQMAYTANDLMYHYQQVGDFERLHVVAKTALDLWRALGNLPMLTDILAGYGNVIAMTADYGTALAMSVEAQEISESLENEWSRSFSLFPQCFVHLRRMEVAKALDVIEESLQLAQKVRFTGGQIIVGTMQAQLYLALGATDRARALAQQALDIAARHLPLFSATAAGVLATIEFSAGRPDETRRLLRVHPRNQSVFDAINMLALEMATCLHLLDRQDFDEAFTFSRKVLAFCEARNLRMFISDFLYFQGQALAGLNRLDEARQTLHRALALLRETGGRWYFLEMAGLLAELEEKAGDEDAASKLRHEARTIFDVIIDQIPAGERRASFVDLPMVQSLLAWTG
jgi:tetratricopeptide (TPR) repeat protein